MSARQNELITTPPPADNMEIGGLLHLVSNMKSTTCLLVALLTLTIPGFCQKPVEFDALTFKTGYCFGACPVFSMSILAGGRADYEAFDYNKRKGRFSTTIAQPQLDSLKQAVNQANILTLLNGYATSWTDHPTYRLTIRLTNGRVKTIVDYGPDGPAQLQRIYGILFRLRDYQAWR